MIETPFVILCHGRSGSTSFRQLLSQHPNVQAYGEVFRPAGRRQPAPQVNGGRYVRGCDPVALLNDAVYAAPNEFGKGCVGFKLFFHHARGDDVSYRLWPHLQARRDIKIVFLFRRNLFDSYVSLKRADRSGQFGLAENAGEGEGGSEGATAAHRAAFAVDLADCLHYMNGISVAKARLQETFAGHETAVVYHEDLFAAPQAALDRVFAFLGQPPAALKLKDRKLNRVPHREGIRNYAEVAAFFKRSYFADFFDYDGLDDKEAAGPSSAFARRLSVLRSRLVRLKADLKEAGSG